jgi:site-specific DNA recombinase
MNEKAYSNAVLYLRVSTKEQAHKGGEAEGYSIPAQRAACIRKAESIGAQVVGEFVDAGESAKTSDRPQLQAMLARLAEGGIQYVIVHKVDRLARNRFDDVTINVSIKQAGARLVSVSENIDDTPSGHLMHGIMSSIAEFYSKNLSTEVMKGMSQKVQRGGTPGLAPIGYINMPKIVEGRRVSTVQIDEERAPIIQWAFQAYATGQYSLNRLTDMLGAKGLVTLHRKGSSPKTLSRSQVHRMLQNKYYIGKVRWNGAEHDGAHTPLVSKVTFQQVQDVLAGHRVASDRFREHNHYLKGSIWCGGCNSRLCFSRTINRHDVAYDYFFCAGRKRRNDCAVKYIEVEKIERKIEAKWQHIRLDPQYAKLLRAVILEELQQTYLNNQQLKQSASKQRTQIMAEQKKLLEAFYASAVPLDLLKQEQDRLAIELDKIEETLRENSLIVANIEKNLERCLEIVKDCHNAYLNAKPRYRRLMNQAVFSQLLVDDVMEAQLTEEFGLLLTPDILQPLGAIQKQEETDALPVFHANHEWSDGVPRWLKSSGWWDKLQMLDLDKQKSNLRVTLEEIGLGWNNDHLVRVRGL